MDSFIFFQFGIVFLAGLIVGYTIAKRSSNLTDQPNPPSQGKVFSGNTITITNPNNEPDEKVLEVAKDLMKQNKIIEAIKLIRSKTNWDLKRSKDYIESLRGKV